MDTYLRLEATTVHLETGDVTRPDSEPSIRLTGRELQLLRYLSMRPGLVVSRDELHEAIWQLGDQVLSRAADNAMKRLRTKVERDPSMPVHLLSVYGEGYRFEPTGRAPVPEAAVVTGRGRLRLGDAIVDLDAQTATRGGRTEPLTSTEVRTLEVLWKASPHVVARDDLLRAVWGKRSGRADRNTVLRLRTKIEQDPTAPVHLVVARGTGYRLDGAVGLASAQPATVPRIVGGPVLGRERELLELLGLLAGGEPLLVTLVGPGGVGKTRLALEAARAQHDGSVLWAELETALDADAVRGIVAQACSVSTAGDGPSLDARVREALARSPAPLLVLDNLEQVIDPAARLVQEWRRSGARILCTSREALRLQGERVVTVGPLEATAADALFRHHLSEAGLSDAVSQDDVARVVEMVGRIPLAVQMAAGRASMVPLAEVLQELDARLSDLRHDRRDVGARHASVNAVVAWSWSHLDEADHFALAALLSFPGRIPYEGALAVIGDEAKSALDRLVRRNLLHREGCNLGLNPLTRAVVRELATEEALARGERNHTAWAASLRSASRDTLHRWIPDLIVAARRGGADGARAALVLADAPVHRSAAALEAIEHAALHVADASLRVELWVELLRLTAGVAGRNEIAQRMRQPIEGWLDAHPDPGLRARTDCWTAILEAVDEPDRAVARIEAAVRVLEGLGDHSNQARAILTLGRLRWFQNDWVGALRCFQQARDVWIEPGDRLLLARTYDMISAGHAELGHDDEAVDVHLRAEALYDALGVDTLERGANYDDAENAFSRGDFARAETQYYAAVNWARTQGFGDVVGQAFYHLALLCWISGRYALAAELSATSVEYLGGDPSTYAPGLLARGAFLHFEGRPDDGDVYFARAAEVGGDAWLQAAYEIHRDLGAARRRAHPLRSVKRSIDGLSRALDGPDRPYASRIRAAIAVRVLRAVLEAVERELA